MLVKKQLYAIGYTRSRRDYSACTGLGSILLRFMSLRGIPIVSQLSTADYRTAVRLGRRRSREIILNSYWDLGSNTSSLSLTQMMRERLERIVSLSYSRKALEETLGF